MSATTSTTSTVLSGILSTIETMGPFLVAGKLSGINTEVHAALLTGNTEADAKVDAAKTALDKFETANPVVQQLVTAALAMIKASGVDFVPSEAQVVLAIKAIIDAAFSALKPAAVTPSAPAAA